MKSRLVLLACCLTLLSSCGQGDKGTGKTPEFAVIEAKTTTANLTNSYPATIKGKIGRASCRERVSPYV